MKALDRTRSQCHLVLVTGYDSDLLHFRNPSAGHADDTQCDLPHHAFASFYAERAISIAIAENTAGP